MDQPPFMNYLRLLAVDVAVHFNITYEEAIQVILDCDGDVNDIADILLEPRH